MALTIAEDCVHFRGDIPCRPHKEKGVKCRCEFYEKRGKRILIIKLGAMGDVLRSTPISAKLRHVFPKCEITWVTNFPEAANAASDVCLKFDAKALAILTADSFDILYNFDKDKEACALAALVRARVKKGFTLRDGKCAPIDGDATHKFVTGVFDDESKANTKSYQEEMFEMAGLRFGSEEYAMGIAEKKWMLPKGKIVGLNTGGAARWTARLWPDGHWTKLAMLLKKKGYMPLLLGGEAEDARNRAIAKKTGALYLGHFSFGEFASLVEKCDAVVTCVTLGLHAAIGAKRKVVLLNNIFNTHEFELYGRGTILEPPKPCDCFYRSTCRYGESCLKSITPESVLKAVEGLII